MYLVFVIISGYFRIDSYKLHPTGLFLSQRMNSHFSKFRYKVESAEIPNDSFYKFQQPSSSTSIITHC